MYRLENFLLTLASRDPNLKYGIIRKLSHINSWLENIFIITDGKIHIKKLYSLECVSLARTAWEAAFFFLWKKAQRKTQQKTKTPVAAIPEIFGVDSHSELLRWLLWVSIANLTLPSFCKSFLPIFKAKSAATIVRLNKGLYILIVNSEMLYNGRILLKSIKLHF